MVRPGRGVPQPSIELGAAVLVEAARLSTVEERSGGMPLDVRVGVGPEGFMYWSADWQATIGWSGLRAEVSTGPPTMLRIRHGGDESVFTLEATAAQTRGAIERFAPEAFGPSGPGDNGDVLSGPELARRLRSRELRDFYSAVKASIRAGDLGERALVDALNDRRVYSRAVIAAALGDARGDAGPAALRAVLAEADTYRDLRCAALLALAKRCGEAATPHLVAALGRRDGATKDCAIIGLAAAGDGSAWEAVFERLRQRLTRIREGCSHPSEVSMCLAYLGQHLRTDEQRACVAILIRQRWERLRDDERAWVRKNWRAIDPESIDSPPMPDPDPAVLREFAKNPFLGSVLDM